MRRLLLLPLVCATACKVTPPANPCDPNPCVTANRTVCVADSGQAKCLCDDGFIPRPSGACEPVGANNCPEHAGDAAEPDDCLVKAVSTPVGTTRNQTIDPPGDYDFFRFDGAEKNVYAVDVTPGGALLPRIDVFDSNGTWLNSVEHVGATRLAFRTGGAGAYYFRVMHSPLDPSVGTGTYSVTLTGLGPEDYGDNATEAGVIFPAAPNQTVTPISGNFLYAGDQDWFAFDVSTTVAYRITFDATRTVPQVAIFYSGRLTTPVFTGQGSSLEYDPRPADLNNATTGRVYLVLYAPATLGAYTFAITSSG